MCRQEQIGRCGNPSHHADSAAFDGPGRSPRTDDPTPLPERLWPDAAAPGTRRSRRQRRRVLGGLLSAAAVACTPAAIAAPAAGTGKQEATRPETPPAAADLSPPPPPPAPPAPPPQPTLTAWGVSGIVQPFWSADGARILYYDQPDYDQPAPKEHGTWSASLGGAPTRERPEWGYYGAQNSLVATPRTLQRDTFVLHIPSGRTWTLPTTNAAVFSDDGTVVAYTAQAAGRPGGPPVAPGMGFSGVAPAFQPTTVVVSGADGQDARRVQLPINGAVISWLPALDGSPNTRLLLSGRRAERDDPSLWTFDLRDRSLAELARSYRLTGIMASPDGAWVAHVAMWNAIADEDGLWVTRSDGSARRRVGLVGSYRWTADGRLLVMPVRASATEGHELWEVILATGAARRITDPAQCSFRVANCDWDCSPDGSQIVFVSAADRSLWHLSLPAGLAGSSDAGAPAIPGPAPTGTNGKPYRLPFTTAPSPSTWYIAQWYGVTTGGYRGRNSTYVQGHGIHFGIDFATRCSTPVVAIAPGRVIAVDGDYGSPPHNVVIQLTDGNIAMYGHLVERTRHVQVGQLVEPGQVVGNTGDSIAPYNCTRNPHLHLEIRKGGRAIATNPAPYFDVNWDDLSLGVFPGPRFERDLDSPHRNQFLDDQPDIWFGGPILTNFARPWPP